MDPPGPPPSRAGRPVSARRRRRRGRPLKSHAKRNTTTREGRRTGTDPVDRGTVELRGKRKAATQHETLSHEDPLSVLLGRQQLTIAQYNAGRSVAELQLRLGREHVGSIWPRIFSPSRGLLDLGPSPAAERAGRTLRRLVRVIGENAAVVLALCDGLWWPLQYPDRIAAGLDRVCEHWSGKAEMNIADVSKYYLSPPSERLQQLPA
jgi:hypothetical protein